MRAPAFVPRSLCGGGRKARFARLAGTVLILSSGAGATAAEPAGAPAGLGQQVDPVRTASSVPLVVYNPADFAQSAPRTAYDLLLLLPGFSIRQSDSGRGLGAASENVLIDGERIPNKQGGAIDELRRTPLENVDRIEIVDAASLGIAGLSGQVANILMKDRNGASGQFEWRPEFRSLYAGPSFFGGDVSYSGESGALDYTLSLEHHVGREAFAGPVDIFRPGEGLVERRQERSDDTYDALAGRAALGFEGPASSVGHLSLGYTAYWNPERQRDRRTLVSGESKSQRTETDREGWYYDINADYEFPLFGGRLKLIALQHQEHEPLVVAQVLDFHDGAPSEGSRFNRETRTRETIGRAEYARSLGGGQWQLSLERAFNGLEQNGALFRLSPTGEFEPTDLPEGSGEVTEVRHEASTTFSRPMSPTVDVNFTAGAEISRLERVDGDAAARRFFRPKGSVSISWRPSQGWNATFDLRRRVGQIDFLDFLAQPKLDEERQNAGNADLVPPLSWELDIEGGYDGAKGATTRIRFYYHRIEDIIDNVPLADRTEGVGNLPYGSRLGVESTSSLDLGHLGWPGVKIDAELGLEHSEVEDPITLERRAISRTRDRWLSIELRHDVPGSHYAWGASVKHERYADSYFLSEIERGRDAPWLIGAFVENKDLNGLSVRADIGNLADTRHFVTRYIYADWRDTAPLSLIQRREQRTGLTFSLTVKGAF